MSFGLIILPTGRATTADDVMAWIEVTDSGRAPDAGDECALAAFMDELGRVFTGGNELDPIPSVLPGRVDIDVDHRPDDRGRSNHAGGEAVEGSASATSQPAR